MDGEQVKTRQSLQRDLSGWIIWTALAFALVAGLVASGITFHEAREHQDGTLREIAILVKTGQLNENTPSPPDAEDVEDEAVLIRRLDVNSPQALPQLPANLRNGLQTITLDDEQYRVFTFKLTSSGQRYAIAQKTELRDDIALISSLNVFLPIVLLVIVMLVIIHLIIRNRLNPLKSLAASLDQQDVTGLKPLPETAIPVEIFPFVSSINVLLERIQQAMQKQYRFIADAAHELRTPVTALSLLVENTEKANSETDRMERQKLLRQGLDRVSGLVSQLLDLARLQSDHEGPTEVVSLNKVVQDAIADLYPMAESAKVDLGVTRQDSIDLLDQEGRLGQLVRNAIDNAIRYTPEGGKVDISLFAEQGKAIFCVDDTGSGIPENELQQVMEPFYRTRGNPRPGNGLGLAISQEIAQRLGGTITLSNRPEGGIRFRYAQRLIIDPSINHDD
ncbi:MAG: two-component sensor histidine kinase [Nitrospinaceae bacterium]|nr:MAG: two-component sensor histidine kinase [Nitrospinaceae bacterium]